MSWWCREQADKLGPMLFLLLHFSLCFVPVLSLRLTFYSFFFQSDFVMCMSAFLVFHKSYPLVLLFVVRLDSFVSCCNSYTVDNTKRLTGMTKLCCSWLSVRWKLIKLFAAWARRLDYPGTNERVLFRVRKSQFGTIKLSVSNVKTQSLISVLFCKYMPRNL